MSKLANWVYYLPIICHTIIALLYTELILDGKRVTMPWNQRIKQKCEQALLYYSLLGYLSLIGYFLI